MNAAITHRYTTIGAVFTLIAFLIIGRTVSIQIGPQKEAFQDIGDGGAGGLDTLVPVRGQIFDRWGHLLAGNETIYEIGVDLRYEYNPETIALASSVILELDYVEVYEILLKPPAGLQHYVLDKFGTAEEADKLRTWKEEIQADPYGNGTSADGQPHSLRGLAFKPTLRRKYPEKNLAANILGFVNLEPRTYQGVEGYFDELLTGVEKTAWFPVDPNRMAEMPSTSDGASLILTIDREIQSMVETVLDSSVQQNGAYGGTIVIMHPKSGEIIAMASTPRIDINQSWQANQVFAHDQNFNLAIHSYEPGSVFKVVTMAAALDSGTVTPETTFVDTGMIMVGGVPIYNWDRGAWGPQTMLGCLQYSLNVCLAWVATEMGTATYYSYLQEFGFGHPTGIELDLEVSGHLKIPGDSDWYESDLATNSFGQGISVTPVQMLMAVSAIANDGQMVVPRVVKAVVDRDRQYNTSPQVAGTPITPETAQTLTAMLAVSLESEASNALVEGYRVAGKTGTAEIATPAGYTLDVTNTSFVGWGPVDDPQFIVYVWLEKPQSSQWGSEVAAPIFSEVVQRLVVLMNLPPDHIRQAMAAE
jgi:cell division protein FtsI/penicillin-binding protein 2